MHRHCRPARSRRTPFNMKKKQPPASSGSSVYYSPDASTISNEICMIAGCESRLENELAYYARHKICEKHAQAPFVTIQGISYRFCQQCAKLQHIAEFDKGRKSCSKMLRRHNLRRNRQPSSSALAVSQQPYTASSPRKQSSLRPSSAAKKSHGSKQRGGTAIASGAFTGEIDANATGMYSNGTAILEAKGIIAYAANHDLDGGEIPDGSEASGQASPMLYSNIAASDGHQHPSWVATATSTPSSPPSARIVATPAVSRGRLTADRPRSPITPLQGVAVSHHPNEVLPSVSMTNPYANNQQCSSKSSSELLMKAPSLMSPYMLNSPPAILSFQAAHYNKNAHAGTEMHPQQGISYSSNDIIDNERVVLRPYSSLQLSADLYVEDNQTMHFCKGANNQRDEPCFIASPPHNYYMLPPVATVSSNLRLSQQRLEPSTGCHINHASISNCNGDRLGNHEVSLLTSADASGVLSSASPDDLLRNFPHPPCATEYTCPVRSSSISSPIPTASGGFTVAKTALPRS